jgi:predicted PurR-regulated permease PerM
VTNHEPEQVEVQPPVLVNVVPKWPRTRTVIRVTLLVLAVWLLFDSARWALYRLRGVLLLLVLAIFFAYLIAPLVELVHQRVRIGRRGQLMPRALAIGIVYLVLFGTLGLAVYLLSPQVGYQMTELGQQTPVYYKSVRERAQALEQLYQRIPAPARESVKDAVAQGVESLGAYLRDSLLALAAFALAYAPWLVLIPILAFFLLKDADSFRRSALRMIPRGRLRWRGDELFQDVNSTLAAYIRAQLIACLLIGTLCTIGFVIIGVPYALVLGLGAGLLEFIPLAGPLTVGVVATLFASFHSTGEALAVLIFLVVLRIAQDYIIYPRIIGQGIHLHPLAVVLAILCGAELAGVAGIFLAIPLIAVISVTYRHWLEHRGADEGLVATLLQPVADAASTSTDEQPPQGQD